MPHSDPTALADLDRRYAAVRRNLLRPPPKLTIAEWADRYRVIPTGTTPEPGPWRTDRVPYLRGIMEALSDRRIEKVVAMLASQTGKTEVILNAIGYYVDQEPSPILVVQPSEKPMGEAFSKDRLAPMLSASPALAGKVKSPRVKDSGNQVLHKVFPGGYISIAGANSAAGLASRPIRVVLCDEVDRYPPSAGSEGDPVSLAVQRTANFTWTRKVFLVSTPTLRGFSRIEKEWDGGGEDRPHSDQRRYFVPCPDCGQMQHLRWGGPNEGAGLKWDQVPASEADELGPGDIVRKGLVHRTGSAAYLCESCGVLIPETRKPQMLRLGEWRATAVGHFPGFHLNALYSPWVPWASLVSQWLVAKDDREELKAFINTKLAETFEDRATKIEVSGLEARAEQWESDVPDGAGVLCGAVDVQGDRLELLVRAYGVGEESWDVLHERIYGDPEAVETWARLDALLTREYRHALGGTMRIATAMVDAGYATDAVYRFVKPREGRVHACMGDTGAEGTPPVNRAQRANQQGVKVFRLGVFALKDITLKRLLIQRPGPRFVHLRGHDPKRCNGFDAEYFAQFGAEKIVTDIVKGSRRPRRRFVQTRTRNEAIDLHAYNLAALQSLGVAVRELMPEWVEQARQKPDAAAESDERPPRPEPEGGDWATGGGRWGW